MLFTKEEFYGRAYKEARRKPRMVTVFDSDNNELESIDVSCISVQVYWGKREVFDDTLHFYYQTLRHHYESEGINWKEVVDGMSRSQRSIVSPSMRNAPWDIQDIDVTAYNLIIERFTTVLPDRVTSGNYLAGMTIGHVDWSEINLIARFENYYIRIDSHFNC